MADLSSLGYVVINVTDLKAWENFAGNLLGFMIGKRTETTLALRMDDYAQRIVLQQADQDDIAVAGWQFDTATELHEYVDGLRKRGGGQTVFQRYCKTSLRGACVRM